MADRSLVDYDYDYEHEHEHDYEHEHEDEQKHRSEAAPGFVALAVALYITYSCATF